MNKKSIFYGLLGLLLIIGLPYFLLNQGSQPNESKVSAFEASIVQPFKELEALAEFRIDDQDQTYIFTSDGENLTSDQLTGVEQEPLWNFVGQVISLQALTLEEAPEHTALEKKATYVLVQDESHEIELVIYDLAESASYIGVITTRSGDKETEEVLEFPNLPAAVADFSPMYLEPVVDFELGKLTEIGYQDELNTFRLSQEGNFSQVEKSPYISGWFLHDFYQTDFSVEYKQMETLLTVIQQLHAGSLPEFERAQGQVATLSLSLTDDTQTSVNLEFYSTEDNTMAMHWQEKEQWYAVPRGLVDQLFMKPATLIDNFVALIPLDAVQSVNIEGIQNIEITHESQTSTEEDTAEVSHEFFLDGKAVEEVAFRKVYQHLAALSYQDLLEEEMELASEAALTITYHFLSEGEVLTHVINFYAIDDASYAVERNGIREFSVSQVDVEAMLAKLKEFK